MDRFYRTIITAFLLVAGLCMAQPALAADARLLDLGQQTQTVLDQVLAFESDLRVAEERYRPVPDNRVEILLNLTAGEYYRLRHVAVSLDGQPLVSHDYTASELVALRKGGMHRIYAGNQPPGRHQLEVSYSGVGANRGKGKEQLSFKLGPSGRLLQISINDRPVYPDQIKPKTTASSAPGKADEPAHSVQLDLHVWALAP